MRSEGTTVSGGPAYREEDALGLPREKRETAEEVRARMEAKAERRRTLSPWNRPTASASDARVMGDALVNPSYEDRFVSPDQPDDVDDPTPEGATVATEPAPTPKRPSAPTPRPITPPGVSAGPYPKVDKAAIVREYVEDKLTINAIAEKRGHGAATVRKVLLDTPGVVLRDDRKTKATRNTTPDPGTALAAATLAREAAASVALDRDETVVVDVERCESCGASSKRMRHDRENVPLCPACWMAEPPVCPEPVGEEVCARESGHHGEHLPLAATPEDHTFDGATVDEVLGALEEFVEHMVAARVNRSPVLGDVVDRIHAGTMAARAAIGGI